MTIEDKTGKYAGMIEAFECDLSLAAEPGSSYGLDEIQIKIEKKDQKILADIELLKELAFGIRHGRLRIVEDGDTKAPKNKEGHPDPTISKVPKKQKKNFAVSLSRTLLNIEKAMIRRIAPDLTEAEHQHYRDIIERHEREISKREDTGA